MGQGTHSTEKGADKSAKNIPNAPRFICLNCLLKPKNWNFDDKKASLGVRSPCIKRQSKGGKRKREIETYSEEIWNGRKF